LSMFERHVPNMREMLENRQAVVFSDDRIGRYLRGRLQEKCPFCIITTTDGQGNLLIKRA
jgi:hypothetical protein